MIDFRNATFVKLRPVPVDTFEEEVNPLLLNDEGVIQVFKAMRDGVVFTTKRIIAINVQGVSGQKRDYTSLPYKNIQVFSIETAGIMDLDAELDIWFAGLGNVRFEFVTKADLQFIYRLISNYALNSNG